MGENCNIRIFRDMIVYVKLEIKGETRRVKGPTRRVESGFSRGFNEWTREVGVRQRYPNFRGLGSF